MTDLMYPATRTEPTVVADAIMLLMAEGIIPRRPEVLNRVAHVLRLTLAELREADIRRERGHARPPEQRPTLLEPIGQPAPAENVFRGDVSREPRLAPADPDVVVPEPSPEPPAPVSQRPSLRDEAVQRGVSLWQVRSERSAPMVTVSAANETPNKAICSRCGKLRKDSEFRAGFTVCKLCVWLKTRRTRWLSSVADPALAGHVLDFNDELIGCPCGVCTVPFKAGDWIWPADVVLAHQRCGGTP